MNSIPTDSAALMHIATPANSIGTQYTMNAHHIIRFSFHTGIRVYVLDRFDVFNLLGGRPVQNVIVAHAEPTVFVCRNVNPDVAPPRRDVRDAFPAS